MEAQRAQAGSLDGILVPDPQRRAVLVPAGLAGEHQVVVRGEPLPRREGAADVRHHRHRPHPPALRRGQAAVRGVTAAHANRLAGEVDVAPRDGKQLAKSQARQRRRQKQRSVLRGPAARTSAWISSGENASTSIETRTRGRSTSATGFRDRPHTRIARRKMPCSTTSRF
jgi:hypothetical protein